METEKNEIELPETCDAITTDIQNNGKQIESGVAAGYVANYLQGVKDPTGVGHNFGYLFGLDQVKWFMEGIEKYMKANPSDPKIEGVRIYLGRTTPVGGANIPMEKVMDSLFFMPVKANGEDLYKVHPILGDEVILGDPRPCPNECKKLSFLDS